MKAVLIELAIVCLAFVLAMGITSCAADREDDVIAINFGDKSCKVKVGESGMFTYPDGTVVYFMRLKKPLVERTTSEVGR